MNVPSTKHFARVHEFVDFRERSVTNNYLTLISSKEVLSQD